jgi:outer membrane lipoprotein carrier protein
MKKTAVIGLILLFLLPAPVLARSGAAVDLSGVVEALENPFKAKADREKESSLSAISDFQSDFLQESLIASLDRAQQGKGKVSVKFTPDESGHVPLTMFRWEYEQPARQEIVSDGKTMWVYLPENNQVILSEIDFSSPSRPNDPVTFLTGLGNLSRDFLIDWASPDRDAQGNYILELRPRQPSPMIRSMLVVVDRDAVRGADAGSRPVFPMLSTTVYDPNDNRTTIEFRDVRVNRGLPDSFFRFIPPEGVEVLRPGESGMGF